jgi:hypothetical protein
VAGGIPEGSADGQGSSASFSSPTTLSLEPGSSSMLISDLENNLIRRLSTADSQVSTVAGSGLNGSSDGPAASASFSSPWGVAAADPSDADAAAYISDTASNLLRVLWRNGSVGTLAGAGQAAKGLVDGQGSSAWFYFPQALSVLPSGLLLVPDMQNNALRLVTPGGLVSTLAGSGSRGCADGASRSASFFYPFSAALGPGGQIYVADTGNHAIRVISSASPATATVSTLAGLCTGIARAGIGFSDGLGSSARFNYPYGIAADSSLGLVYVADTLNRAVRLLDTGSGSVSTLAGNRSAGSVFSDGIGTAATFRYPTGLSVQPSLDGNITMYVADAYNNAIRLIQEQPCPTSSLTPSVSPTPSSSWTALPTIQLSLSSTVSSSPPASFSGLPPQAGPRSQQQGVSVVVVAAVVGSLAASVVVVCTVSTRVRALAFGGGAAPSPSARTPPPEGSAAMNNPLQSLGLYRRAPNVTPVLFSAK